MREGRDSEILKKEPRLGQNVCDIQIEGKAGSAKATCEVCFAFVQKKRTAPLAHFDKKEDCLNEVGHFVQALSRCLRLSPPRQRDPCESSPAGVSQNAQLLSELSDQVDIYIYI